MGHTSCTCGKWIWRGRKMDDWAHMGYTTRTETARERSERRLACPSRLQSFVEAVHRTAPSARRLRGWHTCGNKETWHNDEDEYNEDGEEKNPADKESGWAQKKYRSSTSQGWWEK